MRETAYRLERILLLEIYQNFLGFVLVILPQQDAPESYYIEANFKYENSRIFRCQLRSLGAP